MVFLSRSLKLVSSKFLSLQVHFHSVTVCVVEWPGVSLRGCPLKTSTKGREGQPRVKTMDKGGWLHLILVHNAIKGFVLQWTITWLEAA